MEITAKIWWEQNFLKASLECLKYNDFRKQSAGWAYATCYDPITAQVRIYHHSSWSDHAIEILKTRRIYKNQFSFFGNTIKCKFKFDTHSHQVDSVGEAYHMKAEQVYDFTKLIDYIMINASWDVSIGEIEQVFNSLHKINLYSKFPSACTEDACMSRR